MKNDYEILTLDGFKSFDGIYKKNVNQIIEIKAEDGFVLKCTNDHKILTERGFLIAQEINDGDTLITNQGSKKYLSQKMIEKSSWVYDVMNVEDIHCYLTNGIVSHNCRFLGSSDTLISGDVLETLNYSDPIEESDYTFVYSNPIEEHSYIMCVDVGEGTGKDFSTIVVIDITDKPYEQVFVYRRNDLSPWHLSGIVNNVGKSYNDAHALVENNSVGKIVADSLFYDYDYENMVSTKIRSEDRIEGFTWKNIGIQMNRKTKMVGCTALKALVEGAHLKLTDWHTIQELSCFIKVGTSYQAEKGKTDDLVMPLVSFGWLTAQPFFEDLSQQGLAELVRERREKEAENSHLAFAFYSDGTDDLILESFS